MGRQGRSRLRKLVDVLAQAHPTLEDPHDAIRSGIVVVDGIVNTNPASLVREAARVSRTAGPAARRSQARGRAGRVRRAARGTGGTRCGRRSGRVHALFARRGSRARVRGRCRARPAPRLASPGRACDQSRANEPRRARPRPRAAKGRRCDARSVLSFAAARGAAARARRPGERR